MTENDPLSPHQFVPKTETLLWEGRPSADLPRTGTEKLLRFAGFAMVACFVFFALIGWANRDEMDGAGGILVAFLVLAGGAAALFLWGIPVIGRAARAKTRYGVTDSRAIIVHGLGGRRITSIRVADGYDVRRHDVSADLTNVIFGDYSQRTQVRTPDPATQTLRGNIRRMLQFEGLSPAEAHAAEAALLRIRGLGSGAMLSQVKA